MHSVLPARSDDIMHPVNRVQASDPSLPRKVELAQDQSPASGDTAHGLARKAEHVHSRAFSDSIAQPLHALGPRPLSVPLPKPSRPGTPDYIEDLGTL